MGDAFFLGGDSLLFSLEGFGSSDESDELELELEPELELELDESDFGISGICDGCGGDCVTGGIASSSGSALVPVEAARPCA